MKHEILALNINMNRCIIWIRPILTNPLTVIITYLDGGGVHKQNGTFSKDTSTLKKKT